MLELVEHGVLPGKYRLDFVFGDCDVPVPHLTYANSGPSLSGDFYSRFRRRSVGYTIAYPPRHGPGDRLPLVIVLHGYGGNHRDALWPSSPAKASSVEIGDKLLPPMALVTVDGGPGYWNPHPDDDPFGMLIHELIPMCRRRNLGLPADGIATMGTSMGGYGALLVAEKEPAMIRAVAAISPAIWTSFEQARAANQGAYASAQAFAWADVVTHAEALAQVPVRVAIGADDPFLPGVEALEPELSSGATVIVTPGCHSGPFFSEQLLPSLQFISRYVGA